MYGKLTVRFHILHGTCSITDHVLKHGTRYSVAVTETRNALNDLKRGLLGRGFADHDNLFFYFYLFLSLYLSS